MYVIAIYKYILRTLNLQAPYSFCNVYIRVDL